ncbi:hypothetical protein ABPG75_000975 [Micractinium tetrahymenae]
MSCVPAATPALPATYKAAHRRAAGARQAAPVAWRPSRRPCRRAGVTPPAAAANDESEVAVFRFTLGSDAADAMVPRVVGGVGAALLVLNHILGEAPSDAQLRAEALGAALAAAAIVTPSIEQRLKELQPGRGRQAAASSVAGATSVFALQPGLADGTKQDLAWASYALLRNTNICGLAACWEGRPVLARGLLAVPGGAASGGKGEAAAAAVLGALGGEAWQAAVAAAAGGQLYCPDRGAMEKAGAAAWPGVPEGAESLLAQPLLPFDDADSSGIGSSSGGAAPRGVLLLLSERPRALSSKERAWAAAVAAKLHAALSQAP